MSDLLSGFLIGVAMVAVIAGIVSALIAWNRRR
jgi:hypothetical protein